MRAGAATGGAPSLVAPGPSPAAGRRAVAIRRPVPEGIRITRVGLWYIALALVVGVAAANTGNNGLYMVEALLLGVLAVSGVVSRANLGSLALEVEAPDEVFAGRGFVLAVRVTNLRRRLGCRLLVVSGPAEVAPVLLSYLPAGGRRPLRMAARVPRRGRFRIDALHLASIHPLGLFRKGLRRPLDLELLVFPQILESAGRRLEHAGGEGEEPAGRRGWGHDLLSLRAFRPGDDPRGIHWKRSARTGEMVFMERESEEGRRVSIVCDNAVGRIEGAAQAERFERLVSRAATAALHYLDRGFDVELVTRDGVVPFGRGRGHRRRLLETLALIEPRGRERHPLAFGSPRAARLRLELESEEVAAS